MDDDPATGCAPSSLGLATTFQGAELVTRIPGLQVVALVVRHHHERFDGRGYPSGLAGERIPPAARIVSACDAYGAMTQDRPYRRALSSAEALEELRRGAGTQFDPSVVEALCDEVEAGRPVALPADG